jgi:hypothetical protein
MRVYYPLAELLIDRGESHYTIIATGKGGVVYHFVSNNPPFINAGVIVRNAKGKLATNQGKSQLVLSEEQGVLTIVASILPMPKQRPNPWQFLALRLMCVSIFQVSLVRELIKQLLVRLLIIGSAPWPLKNRRVIFLGKDLKIQDETELKHGYEIVEGVNSFVPIHMASQGYWQIQDEG